MNFCTTCGRQADGNSPFCTGCGTQVRLAAGPNPPGPDRGSTRWPLLAAIVVVLALGGAAGAVLYTHFSSSGHPLASPAKLAGDAFATPATGNSSSPADDSSPATDQASADKTAFVNLWNPIAGQYALQTYQEDQL
jgi:hypothetical protein